MMEWIEGEYYFAVRCKACGIEFPFLRESDTSEPIYLTNSNEMVLTCPDCCMPLAYRGEEVRRHKAKVKT